MEDKERGRDMANRDRFRRDKASRFSDGNRDRDRSNDRSRRISSNNRVFVSNISYDYHWQDMKDLFRNQVGDVAYVEMFVDENDKFKGSAIVEFSDAASVKKCMEVMHRYDLKGRKLVVKEDFGNERDKYGNIVGRRNRDRKDMDDLRDRRDRRPENIPPSLMGNLFSRTGSENSDAKWGQTWGLSTQFLELLGINRPLVSRVFVANLDYKVDEKKLREIFKLAGKVVDIEISHDKEGNSRGFAIVDYDHPVEAVQAISMFHHQILYDRLMTVRMDRIEHNELPLKLPDGLKGVGMGLGVNGEPLKDVSRHLPSQNPGLSDLTAANTGPGILGAVPNPIQNLGQAALSNVVGSNPLNLALNPLQSLTGVQNQLLASNLNEFTSQLNPSLVGSNSMSSLGGNLNLPSLTSNLPPLSSLTQSQSMGMSSYNRDSSMYGSVRDNRNAPRDFSSGNRDYESNSRFEKNENDYQDEFRQPQNPSVYSTINNGSQRSQGGNNPMKQENKFKSDTVIVTNLPATVSWKLLREKFGYCGDIQFLEMKSKETAVIRFNDQWEAERAIQSLDRTRIDGRTIEVRLF